VLDFIDANSVAPKPARKSPVRLAAAK
jgi:hypothetical protein